MHRLKAEGLEDQHVERALDYVSVVIRHDDDNRFSNLDCQDVKIKMKKWFSVDQIEKSEMTVMVYCFGMRPRRRLSTLGGTRPEMSP
jgi:hypothetical protein